MTSKPMIVILLALTLASTALATHAHARTFYLVPSDQGESNETPGDHGSGPLDGRHLEIVDGAPFVARTPLSVATTSIARVGSFQIHLADREALAQEEATTRVAITLRDPTDQVVRTSAGSPYFLVLNETVARTDGTEGWRELAFDLNDSALPADATARGFVLTDESLLIPPGYRLVLQFGIVGRSNERAPGAAISDQLNNVADLLQATGVLPGKGTCMGEILCNFQGSLDLSNTLLGPGSPMRDGTTWRNVDNLVSTPGTIPASTFRADDAGSYLRVASAG